MQRTKEWWATLQSREARPETAKARGGGDVQEAIGHLYNALSHLAYASASVGKGIWGEDAHNGAVLLCAAVQSVSEALKLLLLKQEKEETCQS